jgi:SAM-dependent methyltransferase
MDEQKDKQPSAASAKHDLFGIIEGEYLSRILYFFHRQGFLERLQQGGSVIQLAQEWSFNSDVLYILLEFLYHRTNILERVSDREYKLNSSSSNYQWMEHLLDLYLGAYAPCVTDLHTALCSGDLATQLVDDECFAAAFAGLQQTSNPIIPELLQMLDVTCLLDLGCGPAHLLIEMSHLHPRFHGWGIDARTSMCRMARAQIAEAGFADRLHILEGDVRRLGELLPERSRDEIEVLHGASILNQFFHGGCAAAVAFLTELRRLFPGRPFIVADYYGRLGHIPTPEQNLIPTMIHDIAQALSGQGVPPPNVESWFGLYQQASVQLVHSFEGNHHGVLWFVHIVKLGS